MRLRTAALGSSLDARRHRDEISDKSDATGSLLSLFDQQGWSV